jgi:hypothetical protein
MRRWQACLPLLVLRSIRGVNRLVLTAIPGPYVNIILLMSPSNGTFPETA